uniref:Uncharacterized protein n=1 Tax=viral metagenome TaxID=1070528 RepID=A0A6C0CG30_9ZZZZ
MDSYNDEVLTIKAVVGLMRLKNAVPIKKKQRKTLTKEKRAQSLKTWHQMQRIVKNREATKHRNRSAAMKAAWAKRKAAATN